MPYNWIESEGVEPLITGGAGNQVVLYRLEERPSTIRVTTSNGLADVVGLPGVARQVLDSTVEGVAFNGSRSGDSYLFSFDTQPTSLRHIEIRAAEGDDLVSISGLFEVLDSRLQGESYGTNFYDGGTGTDSLVIAANSSDFIVQYDGTRADGSPIYVVRPQSGDDSHLVLYSVETVRFNDEVRSLAGGAVPPKAQDLPAPVGPVSTIPIGPTIQTPPTPTTTSNTTTTSVTTSNTTINNTTVVYSPTIITNNTVDNSINNSNVNSNNVTDNSTTNTTSTNNSVAVNVSDVGGSVSIDLSSLVQGSTKGPDSVVGTQSGDVIGSGRGVDTLTGEAGSDQFVFNTRDKFGAKGADVITDFDPSQEDQLILGQAALSGISEILFAVVDSKKSLTAATRDDANLIYLEPRGELFYDQNGSGKGFGKGGLFAILENTPALSADDFALL